MGKILGNQLIGKVKTVTFERPASATEFGTATFEFRDEYSIYDYGRMPDDIPDKGEALCRMAVQNFEELSKKGIHTHYLETTGPKSFRVKISRVLYPQKGEIKAGETNYLIPLEIIFRNSLPEGSSLLKLLKAGKMKPEELGLSQMPAPFARLPKPIVDYTTKLEEADRHISKQEAREISFLSEEEMEKMEQVAFAVNDFLNQKAEAIGLDHADGKVEMTLGPNREIVLVDTFGTLDEDRFLYGHTQLSKQLLREYYYKTQWADAVYQKEQGHPYTLSKAEPLPKDFLEIVSNMYRSVCEAWTGQKIWNAPPIADVVHDINAYMEKLDERLK